MASQSLASGFPSRFQSFWEYRFISILFLVGQGSELISMKRGFMSICPRVAHTLLDQLPVVMLNTGWAQTRSALKQL